MKVRCDTCRRTLPISEVPGIVSVFSCDKEVCGVQVQFHYVGNKGKKEYWQTVGGNHG